MFVTHIGLESIWYDEAVSWNMARPPTLLNLMARYPLGTGHPPVYFMWAWLWVHWTGSEHWIIMRLTAALPMLLAVAMTYRVGYEWFKSRWVAIGAATFMATSGLMIYYAREMRMYALLILLVVTSWWLLRRWLDERRNWITLGAYAATVALMGLTHYLSAFIVLTQFIMAVLFYRRKLLPLIAAYLLTALMIAPWLPMFTTQQYVASTRAGGDGTLTLDNIGQFNATRATNLSRVREWFESYTAQEEAFVVGLIVLALALGLSAIQTRRYRRGVILAALWLVLPLALIWGANLRVPLYNERYVLWTIPAIALLVGVAVHQIPGRGRIPLALFIGIAGMFSHEAAFRPPKTPHHEMLTTIDANRQPGDRIWYNMTVGALGSYVEEEALYYLEVVTPDFETDDFIWDAPDDFADERLTRIWDVRPYWIPMPAEAETALNDGRVLTERYDFLDYRVRLYESPPADQTPAQYGDLFEMKVGDTEVQVKRGDPLTVKLWWRAIEAPGLDYSLGLVLRDENGQVLAQSDGGLELGYEPDERIPTSQWGAAGAFDLAAPSIDIPADLEPGTYSLWAATYYWENPDPLPVSATDEWEIDTGASVVRLMNVIVD
jgi:hypothetical protein